MKPLSAAHYGDAVTAALIDAIKEWRREYAPTSSYESLLGANVLSYETKLTIREPGRATIRVVVNGRRRGTYDSYFYSATLHGGVLALSRY